MTARELQNKLQSVGYLANMEIAYAALSTVNEKIPLLIEGEPGCGKTYLAQSVASALDLDLIRVQIYEGITPDKILYDYDYQRQLLSIEAIRSTLDDALKGKTPEEALEEAGKINFYGSQFLIRRPILRAITGQEPVVLLLDEIDKCSPELEYALLEVLSDFSLSIPQYGTVSCAPYNRPLIFLTSNNYRELSDALRRRCSYLYIRRKTQDEICKILKMKLGDVRLSAFAEIASSCLFRMQNMNLRQTPSISEGITWASYLCGHLEADPTLTANLLAKTREDGDAITRVLREQAESLNAAREMTEE